MELTDNEEGFKYCIFPSINNLVMEDARIMNVNKLCPNLYKMALNKN